MLHIKWNFQDVFKFKQKLSKISKIIEIPVKIIFGVYDSNCTNLTIAHSRYTGYNVTHGASQRIPWCQNVDPLSIVSGKTLPRTTVGSMLQTRRVSSSLHVKKNSFVDFEKSPYPTLNTFPVTDNSCCPRWQTPVVAPGDRQQLLSQFDHHSFTSV